MKAIFLISVIIVSVNSFGQDTTLKKQVDTNAVVIHKDPRIDLLVQKQIQINEETSRDARRIGKGYRLLVINTTKKDEAVEAKTKVYTYFPELKTYLVYQSPYFKLKVGNFKDRKEAEDYQKKFQKYFSKGVFIMNDTIEVKLDKDKDSEALSPD